jgi:glycosyltransferase involved in cell wall biosynthesis
MRVLMVINSLILAGAEVLVAELAPRLRRLGVEAEVAVFVWLNSPLEAQLREHGVPLFRTADAPIYSLRHVPALARRLADYDLVHASLFPAQLWVAAAARLVRKRVPLVVTEYDPINGRRKYPWLKPFDRWTYSQYASVPCISEPTRESLQEWVPSVRDKTVILPCGADIAYFRDASPASRAEFGFSDAPLAISVARFQPRKDHPTLLRAVAKIPELQLALVGEGELRPEMERLAESLGISDRVRFLGAQPNLPGLLHMADVFVHSTHSEGFCIAALEGMAAGLPLVVTDSPGMTQMVGDAGIATPLHDPDALAQALSRVIRDPDLRNQLIANGQRRAMEFDLQRCAEQHAELYRRVLEEQNR